MQKGNTYYESIEGDLAVNKIGRLRILYVNVIERNAGWGAEWFVNRGFQALGHVTHCIDYRKHRGKLHHLFKEIPECDVFLLQRGDNFPIDLIESIEIPRFFWASELVSRCRDQDRLLTSGLFHHIFFHSERCIKSAVSYGWVSQNMCSVLLNGFDETIHQPIPNVSRDINVLFVGSMTPRRKNCLDRLGAYFNVKIASAFGEDFVKLANRSKIILNIHAEDVKDTETRVFETLGCGAFLLTERLSAENPFLNGKHLVEFDTFDELCDKVKYYLEREGERDAIARSGYAEAIAHHTYRHRADEIVRVMASYLSNKKNVLENEAIMKEGVDKMEWPSAMLGVIHDKRGQPTTRLADFYDAVKDELIRKCSATTSPDSTIGALDDSKARGRVEGTRLLRIFAAFRHVNWENYNFQPALEAFGDVIRFKWLDSYDQYDPKWHFGGKQQMNHNLLKAVQSAHKDKPIDLFFGYLSGRWVFPGTLRAIREMGIPLLNICLDDRTKFYSSLEPTGYAGMADIASTFTLCWTSTEDAVRLYESVGARAIYLPEGANPEVYKPIEVPFDIDVSFVGQCYGQRPKVIEYLRSQGINVQTFGRGWPTGEISVNEMVKIYNRSRINLGFAAVGNSTDICCLKGRDFEVPMSGAFYLTQYHPELERCFEIGKEIVCYRDVSDMAEKIRYYLDHPEEAERIRKASLQRALRDHTWVGRFDHVFRGMGIIQETPVKEKTYTSRPEVKNKGHRDMDDIVTRGESLFAIDDLDSAKKYFEEVLTIDPNHLEALNNLGVLAFHRNELDLAISLFTRVHTINGNHLESVENLGKCFETRGEYATALKWFQRALDLNGESTEILNKVGNCHIQRENLPNAVEAFSKSLSLDGRQEIVRDLLQGLTEANQMLN